jgi:hypothetical protein
MPSSDPAWVNWPPRTKALVTAAGSISSAAQASSAPSTQTAPIAQTTLATRIAA